MHPPRRRCGQLEPDRADDDDRADDEDQEWRRGVADVEAGIVETARRARGREAQRSPVNMPCAPQRGQSPRIAPRSAGWAPVSGFTRLAAVTRRA